MNEIIIKEILIGVLWLILLAGVWLSLGTVLAFALTELFRGEE